MQDLAGLLHVHDELGLEVRGDDRRDARLRVVLLRVDGHAARATIFSGSSVSPSMITYCGGQ